MDKKYIINEDTLNNIAHAIRLQENSIEDIATIDFAKRIEAIEPTVEEYMRISDYLTYPETSKESDYTQEEIEHCTELYNFYLGMEEINNG